MMCCCLNVQFQGQRVNLQSSLLHITDTVNMPTLKQKCKITDAIKRPLFDLRHFYTHTRTCARTRTRTRTHTRESRLAADTVCYTRRRLSWKHKILKYLLIQRNWQPGRSLLSWRCTAWPKALVVSMDTRHTSEAHLLQGTEDCHITGSSTGNFRHFTIWDCVGEWMVRTHVVEIGAGRNKGCNTTKYMQQSPSWEANSSSATQEIHHILRNPNVHYRAHNSPPSSLVLTRPIHSTSSIQLIENSL